MDFVNEQILKNVQIIILIVISWHNTACYENIHVVYTFQRQPSRIFLMKTDLNNTLNKSSQEIYRRASILKCDFNKIIFQHGFSPVNLLNFSEHLFIRTLLGGCSWNFTKSILQILKCSLSVINLEIFCANKLWTLVTEIWCFLVSIFFLIYFSCNHISHIYLFWGTDLLENVSFSV